LHPLPDGGMTENQATEAVPQTQAEAPRTKLLRVNMPQLLATLVNYTAPANIALNVAFEEHRDAHPSGDAIADVLHFQAVEQWCHENPSDAARIVLCAVYLANGRFVAQEQMPPEEPDSAATGEPQPEAEGQAQPAEGSAADPG
jgi:hypothetical protein